MNIFTFFCTLGFVCAVQVVKARKARARALAAAIVDRRLVVRAKT
jgi:hypothetical protein